MKNVRFLLLAAVSIFVGVSARAQYADAVVEYVSGTGFQTGYTDPTKALGEPSRTTPDPFGGPVDPFSPAWKSSQMVSLGAGGSLTLQFNTPILNNPSNPYGLDFIVFGNTGFIDTNYPSGQTDGAIFGNDATSTRISVSADNVNFYVLNPSLAPTFDSYYPTDGSGNFQVAVNPSYTGSSFAGLDLNGIRGLYAGSAGGVGYDIDWAGMPLSSISYVRLEVLGGNAEIDGLAAVPEPTTWALLGSAAVWWGLNRRRHCVIG